MWYVITIIVLIIATIIYIKYTFDPVLDILINSYDRYKIILWYYKKEGEKKVRTYIIL